MKLRFLEKIFAFVGADARRGLDLSKQHHYFGYRIHLASFFTIMTLGVLFVSDSFFFQSAASLSLIEWLGAHKINVHPHYIALLREGMISSTLKVFFMSCLPLSMLIAMAAAVYYYAAYGSRRGREQIIGFQGRGYFVSSLIRICGGSVVWIAILIGGYFSSLAVPEMLWLDRIPLFFLIQLVLISKIYAILIAGGMEILITLFPYSLHPRRLPLPINNHF